jgi:type II secretory pathway pseudopilin PulG
MKNHLITRAMSLLEVIIAMSLFSAVMVAVLQSMVSATNYANFDESRNDLDTDTVRLQNIVIQDLANAAWFFDYDPVFDQAKRDVNGKRISLYPAVATDRKSIEFIKLRTSMTVSEKPSKDRYGQVNFNDESVKPVDFEQYKDAPPTPFMIMNPAYVADPQWYVAAVWESWEVGRNFDQNQDPTMLRHYLYVVEKNSRGRNSLMRKYLNGYTGPQPKASDWTLDAELIEGVEDATFTTYLEDPMLNENQVRISLQVKRDPNDVGAAATVARTIDLTVAMRSIYQE